jgi:phenylacetate-CoA ligase
MDDLGVQVAFVTSERLYPQQREAIAAVFGCKVANGYGGRDAGFIAHECPSGRMHISAEDLVVEIVDEAGASVPPGSPGEIVVTHMATEDFPFVRYRTGDIGALDTEQCPCGRSLPVLRELHGRNTDFVYASDGTAMHGLALIYAIRDLPGIDAFKIIQHDLRRTEVLLVPDETYAPAVEQKIVRDFRNRLGSDVTVAITIVDAIPREASGKYRYVVSNVRPGRPTGTAEQDGATIASA